MVFYGRWVVSVSLLSLLSLVLLILVWIHIAQTTIYSFSIWGYNQWEFDAHECVNNAHIMEKVQPIQFNFNLFFFRSSIRNSYSSKDSYMNLSIYHLYTHTRAKRHPLISAIQNPDYSWKMWNWEQDQQNHLLKRVLALITKIKWNFNQIFPL